MKNTDNLVKQCMDAYMVSSVSKLAEVTEIPYTTLNTWDNDGPSKIGALLLKSLIENVEMKKNVKLLIQAEALKASAIQDLQKLF